MTEVNQGVKIPHLSKSTSFADVMPCFSRDNDPLPILHRRVWLVYHTQHIISGILKTGWTHRVVVHVMPQPECVCTQKHGSVLSSNSTSLSVYMTKCSIISTNCTRTLKAHRGRRKCMLSRCKRKITNYNYKICSMAKYLTYYMCRERMLV